jgi:hypothetical protein
MMSGGTSLKASINLWIRAKGFDSFSLDLDNLDMLLNLRFNLGTKLKVTIHLPHVVKVRTSVVSSLQVAFQSAGSARLLKPKKLLSQLNVKQF